jgi:hypothetical protein
MSKKIHKFQTIEQILGINIVCFPRASTISTNEYSLKREKIGLRSIPTGRFLNGLRIGKILSNLLGNVSNTGLQKLHKIHPLMLMSYLKLKMEMQVSIRSIIILR